MKLWLLKLRKQPVFWTITVVVAVTLVVHYFFRSSDAGGAIRASVSTGAVIIGGYFITNYLAKERELKEKRLMHCLSLMQGLRFLVLETDLNGEEQRRKLRDELQNAYFAFSLVTTYRSYKALHEMMKRFEEFLESRTKSDLDVFKSAQSEFINELRRDFFIDKRIDFETYDFKLSSSQH